MQHRADMYNGLEFHDAGHHNQLFTFHSAVVRVEWLPGKLDSSLQLLVQQSLPNATAPCPTDFLCHINELHCL